MMSRLLALFYFIAILSLAYSVKIKVANTMGHAVNVTATCSSSSNKIGPKFLEHDEAFEFDFTPFPLCIKAIETEFWCDVSTNTDKKAHFTAYKGCSPLNFGFFLRGEGIYNGTLSGDKISFFQAWEMPEMKQEE